MISNKIKIKMSVVYVFNTGSMKELEKGTPAGMFDFDGKVDLASFPIHSTSGITVLQQPDFAKVWLLQNGRGIKVDYSKVFGIVHLDASPTFT